ncbi:MAG: ATP-binding cassette domain-containing protein [Syntrophomonas sp.]
MSNAMITVENLTFFYPGVSDPALNNINLSVKRGEFIGITGPAGAGKSTLSLSFSGIIPHFEPGKVGGTVYLENIPITKIEPSQLARRIGSVFQDPEAQLVCMSVEEEIAFGMENLGFSREDIGKRIASSLQMAGITELRYSSTAELSGGQKQRVVLASVLAMMPDVLVLDEPTSELDPMGTETVFKILSQINRDYGITVILVEQKIDQLAGYLDRLLVLNEGKLIADGKPSQVLARPDVVQLGVKLPQVAEFALLCNNQLNEVPVTIEQGLDYVKNLLEGDSSDEGRCECNYHRKFGT